MQREDQRPPSSGRPSLLSPEPQVDGQAGGILHGLEGSRGAVAPPPGKKKEQRRGKLALIGGGIALLVALGVGASIWVGGEVRQPSLTLPAPQAQAAAAPTSAPEPTPAPTPAAATIVEDTAAVSPPADNSRSLKEVLDSTPPSAKDHAALSAALERPQPKVAEHKAKPKKPVQVAKKAKNAPAPDSDVTLLAALMAHMQNAPDKAPSTPAYQLKQCKRMNEAGEARCREHLCSTTARNEPECKQRPVAVKTASES